MQVYVATRSDLNGLPEPLQATDVARGQRKKRDHNILSQMQQRKTSFITKKRNTGGFSSVHSLWDLGFLRTNGNYVLNKTMPHT